MPDLKAAITKAAQLTKLSARDEVLSIGVLPLLEIALRFQTTDREAEQAALEVGVTPERYLRNLKTLSVEQQLKLCKSRVAMVGLGGLGGSVLEILARMGVGRIRGADGDVFEAGNLNRQRLSTEGFIGKSKASAARARVSEINKAVDFEAAEVFLDSKGFVDFFAGATVLVDALGGLSQRLPLQKAAAQVGAPLVTGALAGWAGYVSVVLPDQPGPAELMGTNDAAWEGQGCPAPTVDFISSIMARQIISLILEEDAALAGKMLLADLKDLSFETVELV